MRPEAVVHEGSRHEALTVRMLESGELSQLIVRRFPSAVASFAPQLISDTAARVVEKRLMDPEALAKTLQMPVRCVIG